MIGRQMTTTKIETYKGRDIHADEDGFFWMDGCREGGGYFDTVEEARSDIRYSDAEDRANDPSWPPEDTPALEAPWWVTER